MKNFKFLIPALLIIGIGFSQNSINYKAIIKDNLGNVVSNQSVTVQFAIQQGVAFTTVYSESHNPTTDQNGIIVLNIGEGTPISGSYNAIAWGSDEHHLNVQVDIGGGLVDLGTTQFMAVPYALAAQEATFKTDSGVTSNSPGNPDTDDFVFGSDQLNDDNSTIDDNNRLFFDKSKAAFRAGRGNSNWDDVDVGSISVAFGQSTTASGFMSTSFGNNTTASGESSFSFGINSIASGKGSIAGGITGLASGD